MGLLQRIGKGRNGLAALLWLALVCCSGEALAQGKYNAGFSCSASGQANGKLYENTSACEITTKTFVSGFICQYENVLGEVMGKMFCAIQGAIKGPLTAALVLFVIIFGVKILTTIEPFTSGDLFKNLFKIVLIWGFATQADLALGIGYNFFMSLAHGGMEMATRVFETGEDARPFAHLDNQFKASKMMGFVTGEDSLSGFFWGLMIVLPPLFLVFGYFLIKVVKVFARAILGYTLAITGITFLWALMGIFLAVSLFFPFILDKVLAYLGSFSIQLMIVTLFVGMLHVVMDDTQTFIGALQKLKVDTEGFNLGIMKIPGIPRICEMGFTEKGDPFCLEGGKTMSILAFVMKTDLIFKLVTRLLGLIILTYAMEQFLENVPEIAKQLSGPQYAIRLAGITPANVAVGQTQLYMPGSREIEAASQGFRQGFLESSGPLPFRLIGGFRESWEFARRAMDGEGAGFIPSFGQNSEEAKAVNQEGSPKPYEPRHTLLDRLLGRD